MLHSRLTSGGYRAAALSLAAIAITCASASTAGAQSATPLERLQPAPAGDALFASPSPSADAHLAFDAAAAFSFADAPLSIQTFNPTTGEYADAGVVVSHQAVLHLMASATLLSRLKLDLDLPMTVSQGGDSPSALGVRVASPSGFALNDLRVGLRVTALAASGYIPGVAIAGWGFIPTGDAGAFTGSGGARFEPRLIVGADYGRLLWSASIGRQLGAPDAGLLGSEVTFSAGVAARIDRFQIGPEIFGNAVVDRPSANGPVTLSSRAGGGVEALLGAKAKLGPVVAGVAGGLGFLRGIGTPDYRIVAEIAIRPFEQKKPPPGWSLFGGDPASAADSAGERGAPDGGSTKSSKPPAPAPPPDTDGDSVPDAADACPRIVGDPRPDAPKRGCPPDRDSDGIYDADDRCPDRPGVVADGDKNGCPPDKDGDGLADPDDACPAEAGPKTEDPKTTGCPVSVRVEGTQIVILQQVNFETAKARILPASFDLLKQVADALAQHPEIARVAVDGHTDSRGTEASNLELSRARAVSVMRWLTEHGVDARRLEARGFGPRRPIADNTTDAGRAKNRRVEFQIRKRTDKGEAGWVDGPVE